MPSSTDLRRPGARSATSPSPLTALVADGVGAGFRAVARLRGAKALHPRGTVVDGVVRREGQPEPTGVPWLDSAGTDEVVVRLSRAAGLPDRLPDVFGLAFRMGAEGRDADILLSTAGSAPGSRHILRPHMHPFKGVYTSITPYRAPFGLVMLAAFPASESAFHLAVASVRGRWRRFGGLELAAPSGADSDVLFDPVRNALPGLTLPEPLATMRAVSYRSSREGRGR